MRFKKNFLGHTIHVYGRALTLAERGRKLFKERRAAGRCVQCNRNVKQKHIRKGKAVLYRKCKRCREMEDNRRKLKTIN